MSEQLTKIKRWREMNHDLTFTQNGENVFEYFDFLLSQLATIERETEWQDISTAPKDGNEILTYSKKWGVKQLCWKKINYKAGTLGAELPMDKQGAWVQFNADPNKMGCFNPTGEIIKWMPVPNLKDKG